MSPLTEPTKLTLSKGFTWNETVWNPSLIQPALWLDAADASTITQSGGLVSQINDKSGNGRNFFASGQNRPTLTNNGLNGRSVLTFDGSDDWMALSSGLSLGTRHTLFIVAKSQANITATSPVQTLVSGGNWSSPSTTTSAMYLYAGPVTGTISNERISYLVIANSGVNAAGVYGAAKINADVTGAFITSLAFTTAGNQFTGRLNGADDFATNPSGGGAGTGPFIGTSTRYPTVFQYLGADTSGTSTWNGDINEIILYVSYLPSSDIAKIEGYLAHKWGLTSNLPSTHPYKTVGPTP